jgi:hypothetical protein
MKENNSLPHMKSIMWTYGAIVFGLICCLLFIDYVPASGIDLVSPWGSALFSTFFLGYAGWISYCNSRGDQHVHGRLHPPEQRSALWQFLIGALFLMFSLVAVFIPMGSGYQEQLLLFMLILLGLHFGSSLANIRKEIELEERFNAQDL